MGELVTVCTIQKRDMRAAHVVLQQRQQGRLACCRYVPKDDGCRMTNSREHRLRNLCRFGPPTRAECHLGVAWQALQGLRDKYPDLFGDHASTVVRLLSSDCVRGCYTSIGHACKDQIYNLTSWHSSKKVREYVLLQPNSQGTIHRLPPIVRANDLLTILM